MTEPLHRIVIVNTPTGKLSMIRPVAETLLKNGVISGDLDGQMHAADAATVKAALVTAAVCDFCSTPGAVHSFNVPDFDMPGATDAGYGRSTGGWAACDACDALVKARNKKALLERSINSMAFAKFTRVALEELHNRFWRGMTQLSEAAGVALAISQYVQDKLPDHKPISNIRDMRVKMTRMLTGLTTEEIETLVAMLPADGPVGQNALVALPQGIVQKLHHWGVKNGMPTSEAVRTALVQGSTPKPPIPPALIPHWQRALDAKFEAAAVLRDYVREKDRIQSEFFPDATNLSDPVAIQKLLKVAEARKERKLLGFDIDLKLLPGAQAYSFSAETEAAIREAASSIPHDAPLSSIETPVTGSGWFWFSEPLPIAASPVASEKTHALLWAWTHDPNGRPTLMFSAYVIDETGPPETRGKPLPSVRWYWPFEESFHDMIGLATVEHRKMYGPGAKYEHEPEVTGEAVTMQAVSELSLFFVMACVWFRQTVPGQPKKKINPVLTQAQGHVERHARKRLVRDWKLKDQPTVQVVALRKTARVAVEDAEVDPNRQVAARNYQCRWIVKGHLRHQACGPGRKDRKLLWIEAHPAGPEDKPLKTKTTVFAVVR